MSGPAADLAADVRALVRVPLPLPGRGRTAERFEQLAAIGERDLCLAKLVEPHHDATAILAELGADPPADDSLWAVWAAEPPYAKLSAEERDGGWRLSGHKAFCSGAAIVSNALVTAGADDGARLFSIAVAEGVRDGTIEVAEPDWVGNGMRRADTRSLHLHEHRAVPIGEPGDYVHRPGFWHGAVGIAACWLGGARGVAGTLRRAARDRDLDDHALAHLGAVVAALDGATAQVGAAAAAIDDDPDDASGRARRSAESVRAGVVSTAEAVVRHVGHALGPGPLAYDEAHAQRVSDLEVFLRQHHGERDLADLGRLVRDEERS